MKCGMCDRDGIVNVREGLNDFPICAECVDYYFNAVFNGKIEIHMLGVMSPRKLEGNFVIPFDSGHWIVIPENQHEVVVHFG